MSDARIYLVDDDPSIRASLPLLLESAGLACVSFPGAREFLAAAGPNPAGCLLLDVRMPDMSGPELQAELARRNIRLPIVFLTAHADLAIGIEAMKRGAEDFLVKPVSGAVLLERVEAALERDRARRQAEAARAAFADLLQRLSAREREVIRLALEGLGNKDIAVRLGVSPRTVEGHRARAYLKTGVASLLELTHLAREAGMDIGALSG